MGLVNNMSKYVEVLRKYACEELRKETGKIWSCDPVFAEKFAEIIIARCVDVILWDAKSYTTEPHRTIINKIQEHFDEE